MASLASSSAAFLTPGFSGSTQYDGWAGLTSTNYPTYAMGPLGGFPGGAWPAPISANQVGSGDAALRKVSGGGYLGSAGIYAGSFVTTGSTPFSLSDNTPVANLETVLFQIQIDTAFNLDLIGTPTITLYTGGTVDTGSVLTTLSAGYFQLLSSQSLGNTGFGDSFRNQIAFQWDLSGVAGSISAFKIDYNASVHTTTGALQVDQSDTFTQIVPEPSACLLVGMGLTALVVRGRRRGVVRR